MNGSFIERMGAFVSLLPGVLILLMALQGCLILKQTINEYKAAKRLGRARNETEEKKLEEAEQKAAAKQQQKKSRFHTFKIFEVTGESMPQAILQTSIVLKKATKGLGELWTFLANEFNLDLWSSTIVVVLTRAKLSL